MYRLDDRRPWVLGGMLDWEREMYRWALNNPDPTDRDFINWNYGHYNWREARKRVAAYFDEKLRQSFMDYANGDPSVGQWMAKNVAAPIGSVVIKAAGNFTSAAETIQNTIINTVTGKNTPVSQYSYGARMQETANALANAFMKDMSLTEQFFAENGLSMVNSVATYVLAALTKNPGLAEGLLGYEAAGRASVDAGKRGATGAQQTWQAASVGAAQYLGERASFGVFDKTINAIGKKNLWEMIKRIGAQSGVGAIQESATQAMNIISDMVVMGKGWGSNTKSQMTAYFDNYLKEHPEAKNNQAFWATVGEALRQIGLAGGSGAMSGLVMSGVGSIIQNFRSTNNSTLTPDQEGTYNQGNESAGNYEPDIIIGKSVGAKAKNYDILTPDGEILNLAEGTRIKNVEVIAGQGRNRQIDMIDYLVDNYGGDKAKWRKCKGLAYVNVNGESLLAELHWYEEPSTGRVEFKIKPQPGGELFIYED